MNERKFMLEALKLAQEASKDGEVPVGAVVVKNGKVIGCGRNRREKENNSLAHAEIEAIYQACRHEGTWRLSDCEMYVTLEPCPMCCGAIINSRISKVVFGAYDDKAGACISALNMFDSKLMKPDIMIIGGYMENPCAQILKDFFKSLR